MEISMSNLGIDAKNMCPVLNVKWNNQMIAYIS